MTWEIPVIRPEQPWESAAVDTWRELIRRRIEESRVAVYRDARDVPERPGQGVFALVTFAATDGPGLYVFDGTAWNKVSTLVPATLP